MVKSAHLSGIVSRKAGGLLDAVARLVQSQYQQGMEVKVFGLRDECSDADLKTWSPVPIEAFEPTWPKILGRSANFLKELQRFSPDICHTHGLWLYPSVAVTDYSRKRKRPYLISPHGMLDPWALNNSRWKKVIAWRLFEHEHLRNARCIRALCGSEAHSIQRLRLNNDIAVIPNGIDLPAGAPPPTPPWQGYLEPGVKALLFLSRIHPKKGLVNLLHAWNRLQRDGGKESEWVLMVAGWDQGGHESELKQLATSLGIIWHDTRKSANEFRPKANPTLLFLGPQFGTDKNSCYHHCDAFVLPSFSEGLPMVVLEAWANSKPVIMTPECNLPEGFLTGAAVKTETTTASIAASLKELRGMSVADRQEMGRRARALVEERFTWPRVASQLQSVHQWIMGGGAKPDCMLSP